MKAPKFRVSEMRLYEVVDGQWSPTEYSLRQHWGRTDLYTLHCDGLSKLMTFQARGWDDACQQAKAYLKEIGGE